MPNTSKRILVAGAGVTGGEVLRQLTAANWSACALVRNPKHAEPIRDLGVHLIEGDFALRDSWLRALDGVESVFSITLPHRDAVAWNATFLDCAKESGVRHVVHLPGMSVAPSSPAEFHRQMSRCDDAVKASGIEYTILQPNVFFQNMLAMAASIRTHGRFRSAVGDARISMIDVRDIAAVAVKALTEDGHRGNIYVLTGPEALTYYDVARQLTEAVGKAIQYEALDPDEAVQDLIRLGLPEPIARSRVGIHRSFSSGAFTAVTDVVQAILNRPPRPFSAFARDHAAKFR
jgi:uncharacterized protein YbjT (DUF2867 family)